MGTGRQVGVFRIRISIASAPPKTACRHRRKTRTGWRQIASGGIDLAALSVLCSKLW